MIISGEKYACDACIRGHRVSTCQHADRELKHINKKGRPVTQCQHCRGLRKSRSAHVKCDCGEKPHGKDKCPHVGGVETADGNAAHTCCCTHGAKCSCALKKEPIDAFPDIIPAKSVPAPIKKPQLISTRSESTLTVFTNGHHKPCHRNNMSAHEGGAPYKIPRSHTIHGSRTQRSVDHLPLNADRESEAACKQLRESIESAQQEARLIKSEHNSPKSGPVKVHGLFDPANLAVNLEAMQSSESISSLPRRPELLQRGSTQSSNSLESDQDSEYMSAAMQSMPFNPFSFSGGDEHLAPLETDYNTSSFLGGSVYTMDNSLFGAEKIMPSPDTDQFVLSADLNAPEVPWTTWDLPLNSGSSLVPQPPSYNDFNPAAQPGLTASSSGAISEIDEPPAPEDVNTAFNFALQTIDTTGWDLGSGNPNRLSSGSFYPVPSADPPVIPATNMNGNVDYLKSMTADPIYNISPAPRHASMQSDTMPMATETEQQAIMIPVNSDEGNAMWMRDYNTEGINLLDFTPMDNTVMQDTGLSDPYMTGQFWMS